MPKVYNKHHKDAPVDAVYVGRPSRWGNPYSHIPGRNIIEVKTREEAVAAYQDYIEKRPDLVEAAKKHLRGKGLVCWCAPLACHADILLEIANEEV